MSFMGHRVKRLPDGRALANLGCGFRTHPAFTNVDFGPYALLARHPLVARALRKVGFLSDERWANLGAVDPEICVWDMRRGLPFDDATFDVVYHSHVLEHLDRSEAPLFLRECQRVLKPGGVLRVVVPNLEVAIATYQDTLRAVAAGEADRSRHIASVERLFDQMVRTVTADSLKQKPWVRSIERLVRSDPSKTGELHRWMYDRVTLRAVLESVGFREVMERSAASSSIPGWGEYNLDANTDGLPRLPGSLFAEAVR